MTQISIVPNLDGQWTDVTPETFGTIVGIGRLEHGTQSGKPTVTVRIELPDGRQVFGQATLEMLHLAVKALANVPARAPGTMQ